MAKCEYCGGTGRKLYPKCDGCGKRRLAYLELEYWDDEEGDIVQKAYCKKCEKNEIEEDE